MADQRDQRHSTVDDPAAADVILFPDCHLLQRDSGLHSFLSTRVAREHPGKLAVYNERDSPWCRLPGLYVSMPAGTFRPQWQIAAAYNLSGEISSLLEDPRTPPDADLLFSFVGGLTHRCRKQIFSLASRRAHVECTDGFNFFDPGSERYHERRRQFAETVFRSKFVLCPRGAGTSSIRLYETLAAGRVPVVLSDRWVPPVGPDWEKFSIRWPQSSVPALPEMLERMEPRAEEMGRLARRAHDEWFAPDVVLTRQFDQLEALIASHAFSTFPAHGDTRSHVYWWCGAIQRRVKYRYEQLKGTIARPDSREEDAQPPDVG